MSKSTHAAAAAEIRKELKRNNIKATVRAKSYTGGDSVRITIKQDVTPRGRQQIEEFARGYEEGTFDGMTDSYNYDNCVEGRPQVKFVFIDVEYSDEIKAAAADFIKATRHNAEYFSEFDMAQHVHRALCIDDRDGYGFWSTQKPRTRAA